MIREGVDYSGARPSAEALRAAGRDFVVRYARKTGSLDKQITATEAAYWLAEGIDVAIVDEVYAGRMLEGNAAGQTDAKVARSAVIAAGGPADGGVIHFACDVDTTSDSQREAVANYLRGAAAVLGWNKIGVYAEWQVIDWVHTHDQLPVKYLWQTYAWSAGALHPAATLYQYKNAQTLGGVQVDYCRAYVSDFGQWPREAAMTGPKDWTTEDWTTFFARMGYVVGAVQGDANSVYPQTGTIERKIDAAAVALGTVATQVATVADAVTHLSGGSVDMAAVQAAAAKGAAGALADALSRLRLTTDPATP